MSGKDDGNLPSPPEAAERLAPTQAQDSNNRLRHRSVDPQSQSYITQPATHSTGETAAQHAAHQHMALKPTPHWGLSARHEQILFYAFAVPSWCFEIAAAITGSFFHTSKPPFIGTMTVFLFLHWAAWLQTAIGMVQRASWVRDESDLEDRRMFLRLAVRLNRLMMPTAVIALAVFIQAYARRFDTHDLPYWLLFLLTFIWNTVFSVMNAYNNITWENHRMHEEGVMEYRLTRLAILGIPS